MYTTISRCRVHSRVIEQVYLVRFLAKNINILTMIAIDYSDIREYRLKTIEMNILEVNNVNR